MTPRTDEQLLASFARGDDAALGSLAERYEPSLLSLARGLLNDEHLARDAVQESWIRIIRAAPHFAGRSTVKTWIYRVVVNRCLDLRRGGRGRLHLNGVEHAESQPQHHEPVPGAALESSESRAGLHNALGRLKDETRFLLLLCYHDNLTHPEAAQILNIPVGTLKSRLHAALTALRSHLAPSAEAKP